MNGDIIIASVKLSAGSFNYHWEKKMIKNEITFIVSWQKCFAVGNFDIANF